jgi:survival-of-motor-neuron-related-splicing factor 30
MSDAELQTYRDQLAFVNLSLDADPENDDLLSLKTELLEIIGLTEAAMGPAASSSKTTTATDASKAKGKAKEVAAGTTNTNWQDQGTYKAGMDCMAKYKDGKM